MACTICDDTGWKPVDTDGVRRMARCECWRAALVTRTLEEARIPPRYRRCDFDSFVTYPNPRLLEAVQKARQFAAKFPVVQKGLCLIGTPGIGKTHLAVAALRQAIEQGGAQGLFYDTRDLLRLIRSTYNPLVRTAEMEILQPVMEAGLLVLDDLGAEKPSEWVEETMNLIVNTRYNQRRVTIFTSNYEDLPENEPVDAKLGPAPETLKERIGFRIYSRLHEMCEFLEFEGVDYRQLETEKPDAEDLEKNWKRKGSSRRTLPGRAKGMIRAQLKHPDGKGKELGWSGGRAGT